MKHADLRSIAHNFADSFASGIGLLGGFCVYDVFGEAQHSPEGLIAVDFLNGTTTGGEPSPTLKKVIGLYREALPDFCEKHGASISNFRQLKATYSKGRPTLVEIEDDTGRRSRDQYVGVPLRRIKKVDGLGRVRTKNH
jgi:hypothetical protein